MASTLAEELVEEILLRVPPDEPAHLVRATLVCKSWHSIVSNGSFLRRYRRFHGTPPLLGYFCNHKKDLTFIFVPTNSVAASPVRIPVVGCRGRAASVLDCRHGRVLSEIKHSMGFVDSLIVWDPVTGTQHNLNLPTYLNYPYFCAGAVFSFDAIAWAVLCAKDGCDHLDCHSGPFFVVMMRTSFGGGNGGLCTWATVYSSETSGWSRPTPNITNQCFNFRPSLLIGDALYFTPMRHTRSLVKYDLRKHGLSVIDLPGLFWPILMKGDAGGLGFAAMLDNAIHMWSWRAGINGNEEWVKYRVMELGAQVPKGLCLKGLIGMVDGTNTILMEIDTGIFTLDLKSEQVRKIGQRDTNYDGPIFPYMSFYTPKY